jgi:trimethylguanosine synthase
MGKKLRQTNVSGLTRFLQAFDEPSSLQTANATSIAGPSTPRLKRESESDFVDSESQTAAGKRKTGFLGPGNEAYDATGLVPFYTDASQVPAHLQKCAYLPDIQHSELTRKLTGTTQILLSGLDTFQGMTRAVC